MDTFRVPRGMHVVAGVAIVAGLAIGAWAAPVARAATISVNTTVDDFTNNGNCSLREAIRAANLDVAVDACPAGSGTDTITLPGGTYILSVAGSGEDQAVSGDLDITSALTIKGASANTTIVDGARLDRVFEVVEGSTATLANLTVRNGLTNLGGGGISSFGNLTLENSVVSGNESSRFGGGVYSVGGALAVKNSTIRDNRAILGGGGILAAEGGLTVTQSTLSGNIAVEGSGGGINIDDGNLTLIDSIVRQNQADRGGGVSIDVSGATVAGSSIYENRSNEAGGLFARESTVQLTNSTVSGNTTAGNGGGMTSVETSSISLLNVTVVHNTADDDQNGSGDGGGVFVDSFSSLSGSLNAKNTIIARNADRSAQAPDCAGVVNSQGYNLIQNLGGCTIGGVTTGNITGQDPLLGPLQNNGGATPTHAPLVGSPAIDTATNTGCPATDQRGVARPQDGDGNGSARCDIGAYERSSA